MPLSADKSHSHPGNIIAMLVDHVSDPFFANFARRIDRRARSLGYKLVFGSTENDISFLPKLISIFHNMDVAGYIIAPPPGIDPDIRSLLQKHKPVVLFDRLSRLAGPYTVLSDNFKAAYDATEHFIRSGHRHIGFVTVASEQKRMQDRRKGYEAALLVHGLEPHIADVPDSASAEHVKQATRSLKKMSAMILADNNITFGGIAAIRQLKLKIPTDIAVIGFDDNDNFSLISPTITAVVQPLDEMVESILQCIAQHPTETSARRSIKQPVIVPSRLVIRQSSEQAPRTISRRDGALFSQSHP